MQIYSVEHECRHEIIRSFWMWSSDHGGKKGREKEKKNRDRNSFSFIHLVSMSHHILPYIAERL